MKKKLLFKHDFILNYCKGKNVLHIGATDAPYQINKIKSKELLHLKLKKISKNLIGLDFDKKAILDLKKHGINNIFFGDIIKGEFSKEILKFNADVVVFGDVIEHLPNPQIGLINLRKLMKKETRLLLTTPNVFSYYQIKNILFNKSEVVHPDHCIWPSKKTLSKLIKLSNLNVDKFFYGLYGSKKDLKTIKAKLFYNIVLKRKPSLGLCLIFILKK